MIAHRVWVVLAAASLATPLWAGEAEDVAPRETTNGEFLFKHYPPRALAAREQGKVAFRVTLARDGSPMSCEVTKASGYASLDRETCDLIVRYARFQPMRDGEGNAFQSTKDGFVNWRLPEALAANPAPPPPEQSARRDDPDKIICRREVRTGSLVGTTKRCMTRKEWQRAADQARQDVEPLQGKGFATEGMVVGP